MFPQRRVIRNQSLGCIILAIPAIGLVRLMAEYPACGVQQVCFDRSAGLVMPTILLFLGAAILYLTSLIEALSRCIHMKTWRWLLAILPFGPVGIFVFGLLGPTDGIPEGHDWFDPAQLHRRRGDP